MRSNVKNVGRKCVWGPHMVGEVAGMIGKFKGHGGWRPDKLLEICVDNSNNIGTSCMVRKKNGDLISLLEIIWKRASESYC